ncbi:MAG: hypothetical protein ACHQ7M_15510 [Chloroflexota bacterium]
MTPKRAWVTVGVGILGSQAGHLLAFQLIFGSAAQHLQSTGSHAYFPLLAKTALGAIAAAVLLGMFVIGLSRVLSGRKRVAHTSDRSFVQLVAALFTIQLACFVAQEVVEGIVSGSGSASAPYLLLWGTLGQLPVAAVAAIGLRWLWTRFEAAVEDLRAVLTAVRAPRIPALITVRAWPAPNSPVLRTQLVGGPQSKRGPPTS